MASTPTLAGNLVALGAIPFAKAAISAYVVTNLDDGEALVDKTTKKVHLGGRPAVVDTDTGDFAVDLIATNGTDLNVAANTVQYELRAVYVDVADHQRKTWRSGWFALTTSKNLADITTDVSPMAVQSASAFALRAEAARDETLTALDGALADVVDISGIAVPDDTVEALVKGAAGAGPKTRAALSATIGTQAVKRDEVFRSVKEFGAKCDNTTDDTAAVQAAFNTAQAVWFPGMCKVTAPITVTRNVSVDGFDAATCGIRWGGATAPTTDLITFNVLSLKSWRMTNVRMDATNARHAVSFTGDLTYQTAFSRITGCSLIAGSGSAIKSTNQFGYNQITGNFIRGGIDLVNCVDGNHILDNYIEGNNWAVQVDLLNGARNTTIRHNVIVSKGGMLHIVNGSNVRFVDNQCESLSGFGNAVSAMIWIEGTIRNAYNCVVEENNFSAVFAANVARIDNANKTVFDKNHILSGSGDDLVLGSTSSLTRIGSRNYVNGTVTRPRPTTYWPLRVTDSGVGNTGPRPGSALSLQNGWTLSGHIMRTPDDRVEVIGTLEGGTTTAGTIIGVLPGDLRPIGIRRLQVTTAGGFGTLAVAIDGTITVESLPSGSQVAVPSWPSGYTDGIRPATIVDTFDRADSTTTLGGSWLMSGTAVYGITANKAVWVSGFGFPYVEFASADMRVSATFTGTNTSQLNRITARFKSANDHYAVRCALGVASTVVVKIANVETVLATGPTTTTGDTYSLYVKEEAYGTRIVATRNGVVFCNLVDATAGRPTDTKAGLYAWGSFGTPDVGIDNFTVAPA